MSLSCILRGEGQNFVKISVERYERPSADSYQDANWLECGLEVSIRPFRGLLPVAFNTYDFESFLQKLMKLSIRDIQEAKFQTIEEQLFLQLTKTSTGAVCVKGIAGTIDQDNRLEFSFQTDLTFVERFISDLKQIVNCFPVIEK